MSHSESDAAEKTPDPAGQSGYRSIGWVTMFAASATGRSALWASALANTPVLLTFSRYAIAGISVRRIFNKLRLSTRYVPASS